MTGAAPHPTMPSWHVERLGPGGLGAHTAGWEALWRRLPLQHPMLHPAFIDALLRHFGTGQEWLCRLGPAEAPQGLCIVQRAGFGVWQLFLPQQSQVGAALLLDVDDATRLLRQLPGRLQSLDLLAIDPDVLPVDFETDRELEVLPHSYTLGVKLEGNFEAWWAQRPKKLRDNIRRHWAALRQQHTDVSLRWIDQPTDVPAALHRYAELESRGWKGEMGTALTPDGAQSHFYLDLGQHPEWRLVATELWADGALLATRLLWVHQPADGEPGRTVVALKTAHDEQHRHTAPGRLLLHWTLERAHSAWPGRRFEFCTDARGDLAAWGDTQRHVNHLSLHRSKITRGLRHAAQALARTVNPPAAPLPDRSGHALAVQVAPRLADLPSTALELLHKGETRSVQLGPSWLGALEATVYQRGPQPRYAVLSRGPDVLAVWPLLEGTSERPRRVQSMANYYCALTGPVLQPWCKPEELLVLIRHVAATLRAGYHLRLFPLDPAHPTTHVLRAALRMAGYGVFSYFGFGNWVHTGADSYNAFLAGRSGSLRSNIRRAQKRLQEAGARIEIITAPRDVARGIAAYEAVYSQSWKNAEPHPEFFREAARRLAERNLLRLGVVWLNEQPIAAAFWTACRGTAEIHKLAYDERHKALSAGTALGAALFEHVYTRDHVHKVDYLIGDDDYKAHWMNHRQQRWGLMAARVAHPMGAVLAAAEATRRGLKRLVRNLGLSALASASSPTPSSPPPAALPAAGG